MKAVLSVQQFITLFRMLISNSKQFFKARYCIHYFCNIFSFSVKSLERKNG